MSKSDPVKRMSTLASWLISGRPLNVDIAKKYFEVSERTIKYDMARLKEDWHYKFHFDAGRNGYVLTETSGNLAAGAQLRQGHLKAISLASNLLKSLGVDESSQVLSELAESYRSVLPDLLEADRDLLIRTLWISREISPEQRMPFIGVIDEAIRHQRELDIVYRPWEKEPSRKRIRPHRVVIRKGHAHLYATSDLEPISIRNYRMDRMETCAVTDTYFTPPDELDLDGYFEPIFDVFHDGEVYDVKIRFSPGMARYFEENQIHPSQNVTTEADGSVLLEMRVTGITDLNRWVLGWAGEAEVLSPPKLRESVNRSVKKLQDVYLAPNT